MQRPTTARDQDSQRWTNARSYRAKAVDAYIQSTNTLDIAKLQPRLNSTLEEAVFGPEHAKTVSELDDSRTTLTFIP